MGTHTCFTCSVSLQPPLRIQESAHPSCPGPGPLLDPASGTFFHLLALALLIPGSSTHGVTLEKGQAEVWMSPVRLIMNHESFRVTGMQFSPFGRM